MSAAAIFVGVAILCFSPIIGQVAVLWFGHILDLAGVARETTQWGKPCEPFHDAARVAGFATGFISFLLGFGIALASPLYIHRENIK